MYRVAIHGMDIIRHMHVCAICFFADLRFAATKVAIHCLDVMRHMHICATSFFVFLFYLRFAVTRVAIYV
jgi:hypothetical protein